MLILGYLLALLLPVLTHWLSNYYVIRQLKKLQPQIQVDIISNGLPSDAVEVESKSRSPKQST
jgi:hypothetical protein